MPIYEYTCKDCEREFELLVRAQETPTCPICGGEHLAKQLSVPAAHTSGARDLPVCQPMVGCGKPQCGMGGCGMG